MREVVLNGRWPLILPEHRAARPEWSTGWEVERLASMHANLRPGMTVVDVGTEEGDISALIASWVSAIEIGIMRDVVLEPTATGFGEPLGGVILVEPNPRVWPNVKAIWEANDLPAPLEAFVGFCGDELRLHNQGRSHNNHRGIEGRWPACADGDVIGDHGFCNLSERPDIDSITLDALAGSRRVDAITMDTEGSELLVLRGAEETLRTDRPIVWVSVHPEFSVDMYDLTREDLLRHMRTLDYRCEQLAIDHEEHWLFWPAEGATPRDFRWA
jgi:FkbM family methyltransferase